MTTYAEAKIAFEAWGGRAFREGAGLECPSCGADPGRHHYVPCPLDRGTWPCMEWRQSPGPDGEWIRCECGANAYQHGRHRKDGPAVSPHGD